MTAIKYTIYEQPQPSQGLDYPTLENPTPGNLTTDTSKILREEVKRQKKNKSNVGSFIATAKKYTDLTELDATILREFIDKILVSKTSGKKGRRASDMS